LYYKICIKSGKKYKGKKVITAGNLFTGHNSLKPRTCATGGKSKLCSSLLSQLGVKRELADVWGALESGISSVLFKDRRS
jgi:hypothetical protein